MSKVKTNKLTIINDKNLRGVIASADVLTEKMMTDLVDFIELSMPESVKESEEAVAEANKKDSWVSLEELEKRYQVAFEVMLKVELHKRARKQLNKLPNNVRRKVLRALKQLSSLDHPLQHQHVIKLAGRDGDDFRQRVGDYRIKFSLVNQRRVLVSRIEHRQAGY